MPRAKGSDDDQHPDFSAEKPTRIVQPEREFDFAAAAEKLRPLAVEVSLYDPVPMRMQRLMALERGQLLVESLSRPALQAFLGKWMDSLYAQKMPAGLRWHLDVDPLEF